MCRAALARTIGIKGKCYVDQMWAHLPGSICFATVKPKGSVKN